MKPQWRAMLGLVLGLAMLSPPIVWAQSALPWVFHSGATSAGNGNALSADYFSTVAVQIEGTFVGTITFEKKTKDATGYVAVQCTNVTDGARASETDVPGYWECPGGANSFRARISAYTSGTIVVTGSGTTAVSSRGGGSSAAGLQENFAINPNITGADSEGHAFFVGSLLGGGKWWFDPTDGFVFKPSPLADSVLRAWTGQTIRLYDVANSCNGLKFDPGASTIHDAWLFQCSSKKPIKTVSWDADMITLDGTVCANRAEEALNGSEKTGTFRCGDSSSGVFSGKYHTNNAWDGGQIKLRLSVWHGTTETITFGGGFSAQCRAPGEAISSTYSSSQPAEPAITTANNIVEATTTAFTPTGTCNPGDWILWRYVINATNHSTNAANARVIGVDMDLNVGSLSN